MMGPEKACRGRSRGFTLIELMVVVVIVAVLAGIALPAYQKQVLRGNRAAAKAAMLDVANRQQQYLLDNRVYAASAASLGYSPPTDVDKFYTLALSTTPPTPGSPLPYFKISMTPKGSQAADGTEPLTLDSTGVRKPESKWKR